MSSLPLVVAPGQADSVCFLGQPVEIKIAGDQTAGAYAATEATAAPGFGPGPHAHRHEDEAVYVLEGELEFTLDGMRDAAPAGTLVHIPRGTRHAWINRTNAPCRLLTLYTPAGFERIFTQLAGQDTDALRQRGGEYGLELD